MDAKFSSILEDQMFAVTEQMLSDGGYVRDLGYSKIFSSTMTEAATFNFAARLRLEHDELRSKLDELCQEFIKLRRKPAIQVSDLSRPLDLDTILASRGMRPISHAMHMHASLINFSIEPEHELGLIDMGNRLSEWFDRMCGIFSIPMGSREFVLQTYRLVHVLSGFKPYVVSLDEREIGVVGVILHDELLSVYNMGIFEQFRRRGLASSLVTSIAHAYREDAKGMTLQVAADNTPARTLYRKLGLSDVLGYSLFV